MMSESWIHFKKIQAVNIFSLSSGSYSSHLIGLGGVVGKLVGTANWL